MNCFMEGICICFMEVLPTVRFNRNRNLNEIRAEKDYSRYQAYGQSDGKKLDNMLYRTGWYVLLYIVMKTM